MKLVGKILCATIAAGGIAAMAVGLDSPPFEYVLPTQFVNRVADQKELYPTATKITEFLYGSASVASLELSLMIFYAGISETIDRIRR